MCCFLVSCVWGSRMVYWRIIWNVLPSNVSIKRNIWKKRILRLFVYVSLNCSYNVSSWMYISHGVDNNKNNENKCASQSLVRPFETNKNWAHNTIFLLLKSIIKMINWKMVPFNRPMTKIVCALDCFFFGTHVPNFLLFLLLSSMMLMLLLFLFFMDRCLTRMTSHKNT